MNSFHACKNAILILLACLVMAIGSSAQTFNTLFTFDATNGLGPNNLVQATDGNFYGVTYYGCSVTGCGATCGSFFRITPDGELTTLYNFCSKAKCTDGGNPVGPLL